MSAMEWLLIAWLALLAVLALVVWYECQQADKALKKSAGKSPWPH